MRKFAGFFGIMMALLVLAPAAFAAQAPGAAGGASTATWVVITSGFAMAIASGLCGIGQGIASAGASQGFARNPAASTVIQNMLILALVLIESLALYTFVIIFVKVK
ncbi:MAG: ATP synthase F0 subunit C [Acidobacteriota bacterium]|jgi:F-type H+-transporting ATPase subunit c|nr:ATP synthase F0 subunit C [Acidobacteriota bacterium]